MSGFSNVLEPNVHIENRPDLMLAINYVKNFISPDENPAEPFSVLVYPILDGTTSDQLTMDPRQISGDVKGTFSVSCFWRDLLRHILHDKSRGIRVVTENTCGQVFTYELNGPETTYLGNTDQHDRQFSDLQVTATLTSVLDSSSATYTGLPFLDSSCPVTIRISPTTVYQDLYTSRDPIMFALGSGFIFCFAGGLFLLYDYLSDRRRII